MTPEQLAALVADKEAGTPGPWYAESGHVQQNGQLYWQVTDGSDAIMQNQFCWCQGSQDANARRIARVPELEDVVIALVAERDALQAEVARLSTPPDDAEVRAWALALDETARGHDDEYADTGYAIFKRLADEAREVSAFITRLSHALAAETAKREAMEAALTGLLEPFGDDPCRYDHHGKCQEHFIEDDCCVARARATLAKHGSK